MSVTRYSLRSRSKAEQNFYAPMTKGTEIRYAAAQTPVSGKYGSEVKKRLANIGSGLGRTAQSVGTRTTEMRKTADPNRSAEAAFYAPMTEKKDDRLSNIASAAQDVIGEGISQVTSAANQAVDQYTKDRESTSAQIKGVTAAFDKKYALDKAERDKQYSTLQGDIKSVKKQVSTVGTQLGEVKNKLQQQTLQKKQ